MNKSLGCLSLFAFTILLFGCGGGSSNSSHTSHNNDSTNPPNSNPNPPIAKDGLEFYSPYLYATDTTGSKVEFEYNKFTLKDNIAYFFNTELPDGLQFNLMASTLTNQGLYRIDQKRYPEGYRLMNMIKFTDNQMIYSPYNLDGFNDLQMTINYKWVDISGQSLIEKVEIDSWSLPTDSKLAKIRKILEQTTFPKGSACMQSLNATQTKDYLDIYSEYEQPSVNLQTLKEKMVSQGDQVIEGTWAGYQWFALKEDEYSTAYVRINNKVYEAEYVTKPYIDDECIDLNTTAFNHVKAVVDSIK